MKTDAVTSADLAASVIAVPPLARVRNGAPAIAENRRLLEWLDSGGVSTFMYGGNANFYNVGLIEYPLLLELLNDIAPKRSWVIPSIGADFGKALDQVAILRSFDFPTAMALPMASATRPAGVATGLRKLADAYGKQSSKWIGQIVQLYSEDTSFGKGVRVRPLRKPATPAEPDPALNDAIPF